MLLSDMMLSEMVVDPQTFKDVKYVVYGKVEPGLIKILENAGAQTRKYSTLGITHLIAGKEYNKELLDLDHQTFEIPVVTELWVLFSAMLGYTLPTTGFGIDFDDNKLFSGLMICTSGLRGHDLHAIWANVKYHGGNFAYWLDRKCNYLVSTKCYGPKYTLAKEQGITLVCPDFITDCIKEGRILDPLPYHPDLLLNIDEVMKISDKERDSVITTVINDPILYETFAKMGKEDKIEFLQGMVIKVRNDLGIDPLFISD